MIIEEINKKKAKEIIENREPRGLFWFKDKKEYVAIDNSTGEAWTEDFNSLKETYNYLEGGGIIEC